MRKNSIKNTRINGEVQKELSRIISREIKDPRISPMTSVVAVEVAPDLKQCKAYISVLGDKDAQDATLAGLKSAIGFIRRELARTVNLRNTPEIHFVLDQSIEYGVNMSKLIDDVVRSDEGKEHEGEEDNECINLWLAHRPAGGGPYRIPDQCQIGAQRHGPLCRSVFQLCGCGVPGVLPLDDFGTGQESDDPNIKDELGAGDHGHGHHCGGSGIGFHVQGGMEHQHRFHGGQHFDGCGSGRGRSTAV